MAQWKRIMLGMILGIIVGIIFGNKVSILEYLGIIFLNLIKMITIPLIFFTIVYGVTTMEDKSGFKKISFKAIFVFLCSAILAACIGLIIASLVKPGEGTNKTIILKMLKGMKKTDIITANSTSISTSLIDFFVNIIPSNVIKAAAEGNILQIIVFAFFCGVMLKKANCVNTIKIFHEIAQMFFTMIEKIMKFAPFGVFGYIASLVAIEGIEILTILSKLILTIILGCIIQYVFFGIILCVFGQISPMPFYRKILDIQLLAFSTSSSKASLVPMMQKCETHLGTSKEGSRFILPLAASLNMDGGAIYQASAAIFFSQIYDIEFGIHQYVVIIIMSTVASIGGAGIPSGVLLFLGMVLNSVGIPMEGVLIIASIDRIVDMFTTAINVTGDMFATVLLETSEKRLNKKIYFS